MKGLAECRDCGNTYEWDWCNDVFMGAGGSVCSANHPQSSVQNVEVWLCECGSPFAATVNGDFGSYVFDHDGDV